MGGDLVTIVLNQDALFIACADCSASGLYIVNTNSWNVHSQKLTAQEVAYGLTVALSETTKVYVSGTKNVDMLLIQENMDGEFNYDFRENIY